MKKIIVVACLATTVAMTAGTAMADSIRGKIGVTGKVGLIVPADNTADSAPNYYNNRTDNGFIAGGGVIFGIDDHIALVLEATRASFGSETGDFGVTDISFGGQYRFVSQQHQLVPYVGIGVDILSTDYDVNSGQSSDVDSVVGGHACVGLDYFLQRNLALTLEARALVAPDAKIHDSSSRAFEGNFDPSNISTTFGVRFFFN